MTKEIKVGDYVRRDDLYGTYKVVEIYDNGRVFLTMVGSSAVENEKENTTEWLMCYNSTSGFTVVDKPTPPKRHPLGLEPRSIWEEGVLAEREGERLVKINEAIKRYLDDDEMTIPEEWIEEYNEIKLRKQS